jgi:hypothetical protein
MRVEIFMVEFVLSCPYFSACKGFVNRFTISLTAQHSSLHGHPNQKTWIILLCKSRGGNGKIQTEYKKSQKYVHGFPERLCYAFFAKKRS